MEYFHSEERLKADMNSDILLQTYFFYRILYISLVYVMVNFICKGLLELWGTRVEREIQNEKFMPTGRFEPSIFSLQSDRGIHCTTRSDIYRMVKTLPGFTCAIFGNLPVAHGRFSKIIFR